MRTTFRLLPLLALALGGCVDVSTGPHMPSELILRQSPTSTIVGTKTLILRTSLWRDFQPTAPVDGQPMVGLFSVETDDRSPFPAGVSIERAWVLKGSLAWTPDVEVEPPDNHGEWQHVVIGRNGPKWGPGITVDVVVEITTPGGERRLLRQPNVNIGRTD